MSADNSVEETASQNMAIGISFGSTNSSIAFTNPSDGKPEVIANEEGDRQIPSILAYVGGEEYQGAQAKSRIPRDPRNTIAFFRDFLGKTFKDVDPTHCHATAHPIDADGKVAFSVQEKVSEDEDGPAPEKSVLSVHEVAARHLRRLKKSASDYLGKNVESAVVTIPSDSSDAQKEALAEALAAADIKVLQYITEPIAALLAHDAKVQQAAAGTNTARDELVLIADLGGIKSSVSIVASRGGMYTTLTSVHDYELGGSSLDKVLIEYAAKEFLKKNKNATDPRTTERSLAKLTLEAEAVKKALSLGATANFSIESLIDGIDFNLSVNRTRYELLANKVFMSVNRLLESAVQKAGLDLLDIDTILLTGGTSHTPKIASNLKSHFPETTTVIAPSTLSAAVNPSELAVRGAAIQASLISEFEAEDIKSSTEAVVTVNPHIKNAVGLVTGANGEDFVVIVAPETAAPARRTAQITVPEGGDVLLKIAEGVREIKVTQEERAATNGAGGDEDDEDDDSDDEPEETRSKVWKAGQTLAEAAIRGVKKGGKVEIQVNIGADLTTSIVCREVGGQGGVRGVVEGKPGQNGSA